MQNSSHKDAATDFLRLVVQGKIAEAYKTYMSPTFRHHNAYYKSDAASLQKGMEESHQQFPNKEFKMKHIVAEGDLVAVHSRVRLDDSQPEIAVLHLFRFEGDRIAEMWDIGQPKPENMVNELGMF